MQHEDFSARIQSGMLADPHTYLGPNLRDDGTACIRLWHPRASSCAIKVGGRLIEASATQTKGLFECYLDAQVQPLGYQILHHLGRWAYDPYAFKQVLGELDVHLLTQGLHYELYDCLGATARLHQGVWGVSFALWAPNARAVFLLGEFNGFSSVMHPMRAIVGTGVWELFIPGIKNGEKYLFEVVTQDGERFTKTDPVAHFAEVRPNYRAITFDMGSFLWSDQQWMEGRWKYKKGNRPLNIYEVHLGSWKRKNGAFMGYCELGEALARYCKALHYTHVELIGICEHPLDESWGYQVSGYFAPTSRYGSPTDFQEMVNHLHREGIGVLLDWVPGHFPTDSHALSRFDGTCLYEHRDKRQGYHPHWNTHIFNYGRREVSNFLLASALFWLQKMHVDGLRVDAVASMLYLDYGRKPGEWIPNRNGGHINLEALEFIKHLNSVVAQRIPDALMIAEESTAFPGVTRPVEEGGLGFDLKWNLGWMNDTLEFFSTPFCKRAELLSNLALTGRYAFDEKFALVLSHDEVVHCKRSLLSKMPGNGSERLAGLRNLLAYTLSFPGKKLLFMGGEWGQTTEWDCKGELLWQLLERGGHHKLREMVKALNALYFSCSALHEGDHDQKAFEWVTKGDSDQLVVAFLRKSVTQTLLCVHHFHPQLCKQYPLKIAPWTQAREIFSTDALKWGGQGHLNTRVKVLRGQVYLTLPPLSTLLFELQ